MSQSEEQMPEGESWLSNAAEAPLFAALESQDFAPNSESYLAREVYVFETTISRHYYSGVENCDDARARKEAQGLADQFASQKQAEHPKYARVRHGWKSFQHSWWRQRGNILDGRRSCGGQLNEVKLFAVFEQWLAQKPEPDLYTRPHVAIRPTTWIDHPAARTPKMGTIEQGEQVLLRDPLGEPDTYQYARIAAGDIVLINPADFSLP